MSQERFSSTQPLLDEKQALSVYFEALLREPVETEPPVQVPVQDDLPATAPSTAVAAPPGAAPAEADIPQWGEGAFQAMLFKVAGLTLAVPLVELSGVQEWQRDAVTPLPGHAPWYLGLVDYRGRSVPVVDTALLVLPAERLRRLTVSAVERLQRIVFIGEGRWGLGCDEVAEVLTLTPDRVRWRTSRTRRRWLAGTVIDHMCAIIDPPAFARMLATGIEDTGEGLEES